MTTSTPSGSAYMLGDEEHELARLTEQARFIGELTRDVLVRAGIKSGMRVLDVGCGPGDVSLLAAELVGPNGSVVAIDRSEDALQLARRRAVAAGVHNIEFKTGDLLDFVAEPPLDALIGRLVLMYFSEPARVLRALLRSVKPGGVVVFHEFDMERAESHPPCATWDAAMQRLIDVFRHLRAEPRMGLKLSSTFAAAGLPAPEMILAARVESGAVTVPLEQVAGLTRTLLPVMLASGIASAEEVGIDTLVTRMRAEVAACGATLLSPAFIGAWTTRP